MSFADGIKAKFGASNDFALYHDASNSLNVIDAVGHDLELRHNAEKMIICKDDGAVELYHDNAKKLETIATGVLITGSDDGDGGATGDFKFFQSDGSTLKVMFDASAAALEFVDSAKATFGDGDDLQIYHNASHSYITNATGKIFLQAKAGEHSIECEPDESVKLYYNNAKKLETLTNGIAIDGVLRIGGTAAANEFDDYEEGTFTLSPNLNNVSIDQNTFNYVKTGRSVHYHGRLHYDSASGSSDQILGLPFAPNEYFMTASVYVDSGLTLTDDYFCVYTGNPQARLHMAQMAPAAGINMPGAADIYITGFYFTDS